MQSLPSVKDVSDLKGKRVLLRASLNVPTKDGVVQNQFRILRALPTIQYLKEQGAKVVLIAHIGRDPNETLKPVYDVLNTLCETKWVGALTGEEVLQAVNELADGEVVMLENVRSDAREKDNDAEFSATLASYADVYVNDAFSDSHRSHASLTGVAGLLPGYFGFNFLNEYNELSKAMEPEQPALFILGGAKFDTKMPLVEKYTETYSTVLIAGALANDIYKARGLSVGKSLVSEVDLSDSPLLEKDNVLVPVDVTTEGPEGSRVTSPDDVHNDESILDAGPATIEMMSGLIKEAKTILWNGPLGGYEQGFIKETEALAKAIAASDAYTIVGGGDTVAAIESVSLQDHFDFLSTAGGAMLTFLEHGTLPAIEAITKK